MAENGLEFPQDVAGVAELTRERMGATGGGSGRFRGGPFRASTLVGLSVLAVAYGIRTPGVCWQWDERWDAPMYQAIAANLVEDHTYSYGTGAHEAFKTQYRPLTSFILAGSFLAFGTSPWVAGATTVALGIAACYCFFLLARLCTGRSDLAFLGTAWFVLLPASNSLLYYTNSEVIYMSILIAAGLAYYRTAQRDFAWPWIVLCGLVLGLLPVCRITGLSLLGALPVLGLCQAFLHRRPGLLWRHIVMAAAALSWTVPWAVRDFATESAPTWTGPFVWGQDVAGWSFWLETFLLRDFKNPDLGYLGWDELFARAVKRLGMFAGHVAEPFGGYAVTLCSVIYVHVMARAVWPSFRTRRESPRPMVSLILFFLITGVHYVIAPVFYSYSDYRRFSLPYSALLILPLLCLAASGGLKIRKPRRRPYSILAAAGLVTALLLDIWHFRWLCAERSANGDFEPPLFGASLLILLYAGVAGLLISDRRSAPILLRAGAVAILITLGLLLIGNTHDEYRDMRDVRVEQYRKAFRKLGRRAPPGTVVVGYNPGLGYLESDRRLHVIRSPQSRKRDTFNRFLNWYRPRFVVRCAGGGGEYARSHIVSRPQMFERILHWPHVDVYAVDIQALSKNRVPDRATGRRD